MEIEAPSAELPLAAQNGYHTAIDVVSNTNGLHQEEYTRKERKAEEEAGLLKGQTLSSASGV